MKKSAFKHEFTEKEDDIIFEASDISRQPDSRNKITRKKFVILMIAPTPFYSGRGTHMRILHEAQALAKRGHKIVITTYHIGDNPADLRSNIKIKRINRILFWYTKRESGPNWQKLCLDLLLCIKVFRICLRSPPHILHGHLHEGVLIGWIVKKLLFYQKMPLVGDFHGPLVQEMRSHGYLRYAFIHKIFDFIENRIARMPGGVITSSPGLKNEIGHHRKKPDVHIVPDAPTLADLHVQPAIISRKPKPGNPISVIYTGGFTPDKGLSNLFQVIARSIENSLSCEWIIAGGPRKRLALPPVIQDAVRVISPLDHNRLNELLQNADIACEPKQGEILQGSGKLLNYMYAGLPTVCFDGPAQRYYLGDELASKLIAKDTSQFYSILKNLIEMPADERDRLRKMIRQRVKRFSWEHNARILEQQYTSQWHSIQK